MGRSPGKWLKSLLAGKKSSKSGTSKKSSNEKASITSTNAELSNSSVDLSLVREPAASRIKEDSKFEKGGVADEIILPSTESGEAEQNQQLTLHEDTEKLRLEQAAMITQAIFRGFLARREFLRLKGIIRLQALIRGHLVRRQAIATLFCIHGIVKLQARVRGHTVRRSGLGLEVITKLGLMQQDVKQADCQKTNTSKLAWELSKSEFTTKLLASSPAVLPLHFQYGPEEPNSSHQWLSRWTISRIWKLRSKPKTLSKAKHQKVEADLSMSKHNGWKVQSRKIQNGPNHSSSGSEKKKSSHLVKHNLKKVPSPNLEKPVPSEVDTEKKMQNHDKSSSIMVPEESIASDESMKRVEGKIKESTNVETPVETLVVEDTITHLDGLSVVETLVVEDACSNHDKEGNKSNKTNRRVSLPAKVPSYMAPTKSAKAKLKEQGSPRFAHDTTEKNVPMRRHSLPSPMNGKLSGSPRVQRLVQACAKEGMKIDRSLSSSRDGTDKMTRAEWKR